MGNLESNSNRLRKVRTALLRIDAGTFGICVGCEESINPRLSFANNPSDDNLLSFSAVARTLPVCGNALFGGVLG
jgi:hypothetical protein